SAYTASNGVKLVGADFQIDTSDTNPSLEVADGGLRAKVDDTSVQRTAGGLAIKAVDGSVLTGLPSTPSGAGKLPTVNLGTGTADNTRFLRGDQSWAEPPGGAGVVSINYTKALDTDIVPVTVFGTAAETTFHSYTVPAGTLGTDKIIRLTLAGTYRNNTNSNQVLGARLKYGGTILCSRISGSIGKDAGTGSFAFVFHLAAAGATDAQQGFLQCSIESGADVSVNWDDRGRSTIDSTAEQTLLITVWHSLGHSQLTITKLIAHAELLNASDTVGAPLDASYITIAANGSLTAERALTAGEGIDLTDGGANSTITIDGEDASDTNKGIVELATAAETTTGTDAGRAVTPDALAGSDYGKRIVEVKVIDDATHLATGDGKAIICIPAELNGWNLVAAHGFVTTPDAAAVATFQVRNVTDAVDMLSTPITIDATEYTSYTAAAPPVIDAAHDDVATGDLIAIDKDVAGTAEKGDGVILVFALP
ncbi:hypothetical protein KKC06_06815, partial [Patescibacteria group bacterium]|nr:hypothetical protein [Patescibacteria group bacterium]